MREYPYNIKDKNGVQCLIMMATSEKEALEKYRDALENFYGFHGRSSGFYELRLVSNGWVLSATYGGRWTAELAKEE